MRSCSCILLRARVIAFHTPTAVVVDGVAVVVDVVVVVVVCCLLCFLVACARVRVFKDSIMVGATTEAGKGESHFQRKDTTDLVIRSKANSF